MLRISTAGRWAVLLFSSCLSTLGGAAGQRSFVSGTGVDNPSCSLAAPCRQFAAAVTATSPSGEVIVLDSAGYGVVTITKSISIIAAPGVYAGISVFPGFDGIAVIAPGAFVRIVGIAINGQGGNNGIAVLGVARLSIERCLITNMAVHGISATGAVTMEIRDSLVANNATDGVMLAGSGALVVNSRAISNNNNGVSVYLGSSATLRDVDATANQGSGLSVKATNGFHSIGHVEGGTFTANGLAGANAENSGTGIADLDIARATLSQNAFGITAISSSAVLNTIVTASSNIVSQNTSAGLSASGAGATITGTGNVVTRSPVGVTGVSSATVRLGGDNTVLLNDTNIGPGVSSYGRI